MRKFFTILLILLLASCSSNDNSEEASNNGSQTEEIVFEQGFGKIQVSMSQTGINSFQKFLVMKKLSFSFR